MSETILLIEDEPELKDVLCKILEEEGYDILKAENGKDGVDLFHQHHPDLVITDLRMPQKDGLYVINEVVQSKRGVDVIILTGHIYIDEAIKCIQMGAYDFMRKPLDDIDLFLNCINHALEKRRLIKRNRELEEMITVLTEQNKSKSH
ncbi:MAG: response regulator [Desulfobacterales bacterium]|nr:response regulator [Desulfobacterales bacterium]